MADESGSGFGGGGFSGGGFGDYESLEQGSFAVPGGAFGPTLAEREETARKAAAFQAALGRYGLSPMDLMGFAQAPGYRENIAATMDSLGFWDRFGDFARGFAGRKGGLYDMTGFYSPTEQNILDLAVKGMSVLGPAGMVAGRTARGLANIATDTTATQRGIGFGLSDRGIGLGAEQNVAGAMGGDEVGQQLAEIRAELDRLLAEYRMQDVFGG